MAVTTYRISKYDPAMRDVPGSYSNTSEWTAITDIVGKTGSPATYADYKGVEDAYVATVAAVMREKGIEWLHVEDLELYTSAKDFDGYRQLGILQDLHMDYDRHLSPLHNGIELPFPKLDNIIRLILREIVWMTLKNTGLELRFGYDYYMYVITQPLCRQTIEAIESSGLFVELME